MVWSFAGSAVGELPHGLLLHLPLSLFVSLCFLLPIARFLCLCSCCFLFLGASARTSLWLSLSLFRVKYLLHAFCASPPRASRQLVSITVIALLPRLRSSTSVAATSVAVTAPLPRLLVTRLLH